jgi:hypothetical protein
MADHPTKSYKIVAVSLYLGDAAKADELVNTLHRAGWPSANRSLIVREALLRLSDELAGKSDEDILNFFVDSSKTRSAKRQSTQSV